MPTYTAPELVAATIAANAVAELTLGTNIFAGPLRPVGSNIPRNCTFCYPYINFSPGGYFGTAKKDFREFRVTITTRYEKEKYVEGAALSRDIWDALHRLEPSDFTSYTGYYSCLMAETLPNYFGLDDQDNHRFVQTARLWFEGS